MISRGKYFSSCSTWGVGNSFQTSAIWRRVFGGAKRHQKLFLNYDAPPKTLHQSLGRK